MSFCTVIDIFFALPQFIVNNLYGFFGAVPIDVSSRIDAIFGCVATIQ
ncbi:MAG TPA: hypothetical protein VNT79_10060 [Phycisphaerae bacterium]|nr:hypothetical protein [Phycisphaerae bacterium]